MRYRHFAMTLVLSITTLSTQVRPGDQGAAVAPSQSEDGSIEVRPDPYTRRRLCPNRVVLYVSDSRLAKKELTAQTRSLANLLHRPVVGFAWPEVDGEQKHQRLLAAYRLRLWIGKQQETKTRVEIITHGKGADLVKSALRGATLPEPGITLYAMDRAEDLGLPGVEVWRLVGDRVLAPSKEKDAKQEGEAEAIQAAGTGRFDDYLHRLQMDVYGKALDDLLRPPEPMRYPYRPDLLEWRAVADASYTGRPGHPLRQRFDVEEEQRRLDKWLSVERNRRGIEKDPRSIRIFNRLTAAKGGPKHWFLMWYPMARTQNPAWHEDEKGEGEQGPPRWIYQQHSLAHQHFLPINMHEEAFLASDFDPKSLKETSDQVGRPCLAYSILTGRAKAYGDVTERCKGHYLAIIVRGQVEVAPKVMSRIPRAGQITGAFTKQEIASLIQDIRSSGLREPDEDK